eukprot:GHVH01016701.1.p1 GENE.GHVH01016701.1~~GHVH01016701.1.p1  ORF type:complete len:140 (-),score=16.71 GHVH01016701.1:63-482(-)
MMAPEFGYVMIMEALCIILNFFQMMTVARARKAYDVQPPTLYAPADHKHADEFNRVQRAHQNLLEFLPMAMVLAACGGLAHPIVAAVMLGIFIVGRLIYVIGYTKNAAARVPGFMMATFGGFFPLAALNVWSGVELAFM